MNVEYTNIFDATSSDNTDTGNWFYFIDKIKSMEYFYVPN